MPSNAVVPTDFAAIPPLVAAQNDMRQMAGSAPNAALRDFISQVDVLGRGAWPQANSQIQTWATELLTLLVNTQTSSMPVIQQVKPIPTIVTSIYVCTCFGTWWYNEGDSQYGFEQFLPGTGTNSWAPPSQPPIWTDSVGAVLNALGGLDSMLFQIPGTLASFPDPWTDYGKVTAGCTLWTEESAGLQAMLGSSTVTADQCPLLVYLLLALTSSAAQSDQALVQKISGEPSNSTENANSNLGQQLIYFLLMYLSNPFGLGWAHDQILTWVQTLIAAVPANTASASLSQILTQQTKILVSDASYPMVDPYNPAIGFNQRYSDTLAAINLAWASLSTQ